MFTFFQEKIITPNQFIISYFSKENNKCKKYLQYFYQEIKDAEFEINFNEVDEEFKKKFRD